MRTLVSWLALLSAVDIGSLATTSASPSDRSAYPASGSFCAYAEPAEIIAWFRCYEEQPFAFGPFNDSSHWTAANPQVLQLPLPSNGTSARPGAGKSRPPSRQLAGQKGATVRPP